MNPCMTDEFGEILKALRKLRGITQQDMAKIINTSRSCVSNYESGNRQPDSETIKLIADYFDVSIDYLLGRSSEKNRLTNADIEEDVRNELMQIKNLTVLDISRASTKIKCALVEYYAYLMKKEKKEHQRREFPTY